MSKIEAEIWNFLILWCHTRNAAHLESIYSWMPTCSESEVHEAIELMLKRRLPIITRVGFLPMVGGSPYSTARKNRKWRSFPKELLMSPGTIH